MVGLGREAATLERFERESERQKAPNRQLYLAGAGFGIGVGFLLLLGTRVAQAGLAALGAG